MFITFNGFSCFVTIDYEINEVFWMVTPRIFLMVNSPTSLIIGFRRLGKSIISHFP